MPALGVQPHVITGIRVVAQDACQRTDKSVVVPNFQRYADVNVSICNVNVIKTHDNQLAALKHSTILYLSIKTSFLE